MYQHILLPTDGSEFSKHTFSTDPLMVTDLADDYEGDARKAGQQYMGVIEAAALAAGVPYEGVHVLHIHPYRAILDEATSAVATSSSWRPTAAEGWPPSCSAAKPTRS
jgi:hypothetical protein